MDIRQDLIEKKSMIEVEIRARQAEILRIEAAISAVDGVDGVVAAQRPSARAPRMALRETAAPTPASPVERRVLEVLADLGALTTSEILEATDMPRGTVSCACTILHRKGRLARTLVHRPTGKGRTSVYRWALVPEAVAA